MVSLVEQRLVVQLEIAMRVAMHLYAIGCWWDALMWAIYLVLCLGESWRSSLAVLGHAVVEEVVGGLRHVMAAHILDLLATVGAITVVLGKLRGKLALEMVDIERLGQIGELVPIRGGSFVIVTVNAEVQV
jgi:hypothetical protein